MRKKILFSLISAIIVTRKSGADKIFDNAHLEGFGVMDGARLYEKYAKEAIK